MGVGTMLQPHEAAKMGETLLKDNRRLLAENEALREKNEKLQQKHGELTERYKLLSEFEPLLEDTPAALQVWIRDKRVIRQLMARALRVYGKAGQLPSQIDDEKLRRRARLNFDALVEACCKHGLFDAWERVYSAYLRDIKL